VGQYSIGADIQNKTGARLGIEITGELAETIERINARPRKAISAFLIQDENGQPLSQGALRSRFDKAREASGVQFQFRIFEVRLRLIPGAWLIRKATRAQKSGDD
jgi:hypothetical protein